MSSESGQLVKASSFGVGLAGMPVGRCELETVKAEAGCHHARHQRPPTERRCRLPLAGRDDHLGSLAGREVSSKHVMLQRSVTGRDRQPQRATIVMKPQFVGIDSMPVRPLTRSQQEVDARARRSLSLLNRRSPGFDVPAAFRMGLQSERVDELVGVHIPTVCPPVDSRMVTQEPHSTLAAAVAVTAHVEREHAAGRCGCRKCGRGHLTGAFAGESVALWLAFCIT
jgi:hypothetical protein